MLLLAAIHVLSRGSSSMDLPWLNPEGNNKFRRTQKSHKPLRVRGFAIVVADRVDCPESLNAHAASTEAMNICQGRRTRGLSLNGDREAQRRIDRLLRNLRDGIC